METRVSKERDLVLPPNTYAFILNKQKGDVDVYVGPHKSNLDDNTDQPVTYDYAQKNFLHTTLNNAIQTNVVAPEGWYLVLKNPAKENKHPGMGQQSSRVDLDVGRKINLPGPMNFALYPGQMCKVVQGHHLKSNQYLVARVYDVDALESEDEVTVGQLRIIKGVDQSFYIPPTGIEVLKIDNKYTQDAVTLERLQYCVLLDEDGNKEYMKGPDVVFPRPTQKFIEKDESKVHRAFHLNQISGIYVQVTTEYDDHKPGDELFITGKNQAIYYPREEHAIIKYDGNDVHYATAIPSGEGRYLLNRLTGEITLKIGPDMLLPDPRTHVLVRRVLTEKEVKDWYPGNQEALDYNLNLSGMITQDGLGASGNDYMTESSYRNAVSTSFTLSLDNDSAGERDDSPRAMKAFVGNSIDKKSSYTKPRSIIVDSKYEGSPRVSPWRGYAILIENKSEGNTNRVVVGPKSLLLEYDESLVSMELSRGNPKNDNNVIRTPYLRHMNNTVSDTISGETEDLVEVDIQLSYKVDFTGDEEKWFNVENYVQYLCDRMRSMIRKLIKSSKIEDFNNNYVDLIRDMVLGKNESTEESTGRIGYLFEENGMKITDVEVLRLDIDNDEIRLQLHGAQIDAVKKNLESKSKDRELTLTKKIEETNRSLNKEKSQTAVERIANDINETKELADLHRERAASEVAAEKNRLTLEKDLQDLYNCLNDAQIKRDELKGMQTLQHEQAMVDVIVERDRALTENAINKFKAITPRLVAAMESDADKKLLMNMSENFNIQSMLGAKSLVEAINGMIHGTSLEGKIDTAGLLKREYDNYDDEYGEDKPF